MIAAVIALLIPWLSPLSFSHGAPHWTIGQSGTTYSRVGSTHRRVAVSTAWATNVRYVDKASADPPTRTLEHLGTSGILVWAVIEPRIGAWPPDGRRLSIG